MEPLSLWGAPHLACIGLNAAIHMLPPSFTQPFTEHTAGMLGEVLNALGIAVTTANAIVSDSSFALQIIPECTALFMVGFFLIHLFHRIDNVLIVLFNFTGSEVVDLTLVVIGQYLLPVLFLLFLIRRQKQEILLDPKIRG